MDLKQPETIRLRSTLHPMPRILESQPAPRPDVKHALVVVNRMLRSSPNSDDRVKDRILQVAGILRTSDPTPTAFVSGRPVDVAFRIASRLIRRLGF